MGETIFHPKPPTPSGHPGIDFQWNERTPIIASSDGIIININHGSSHGIDVIIRESVYELRYKELDESSLGENIKINHNVKRGDFIGFPGGIPGGDGKLHYQLHWEFASSSPAEDRFCPMTYFYPESRERIQNIWDNVSLEAYQGLKKRFPYICSGDYYGKDE